MSGKFGRTYTLEAELADHSTMTIKYPITMQFSVRKDINPSANRGTFRLYNLAEEHRNLLYKDVIDTTVEHRRKLVVNAGYEGTMLAKMFAGSINEAGSYRVEGTTEFITEIDGYDGISSMIQSYSSFSLPAGSTKQQAINQLVADLQATGVNVLKVENYSGTFPRPYTANGYSWALLQELTDFHCCMQNEGIYIYTDNGTIDTPIYNLSSSTGLLGSPKKCDTFVEAYMLFEPSLAVGGAINLQSTSFSTFNGTYKITAVEHSGIISGSVNGKCKTKVELYTLNKQTQLAGITV